jgi:cytochrome c biogenesis protein CcdA
MSNWYIVLAGIFAIFFGNEFYCLVTHQPTLSMRARELGKRYPVIAFLLGMVVGVLMWHFWGCTYSQVPS